MRDEALNTLSYAQFFFLANIHLQLGCLFFFTIGPMSLTLSFYV